MPRQNIYRTDPVLTNVAIQYRNPSYAKPIFFPDTTVQESSGKWFVYDKANNLSGGDNDELALNSRSASIEDEMNMSLAPYGPIPKRSRKIFVTDDEKELAPAPLNPRADATEVVTDRYDLRGELQAASIMQNASNFGSTVTKSGTGQWSDYTNSDPLTDIENAVLAVNLAAGTDPDSISMPFQVWRILRRHPKLVGLFSYTSGGLLSKNQFMELLNEYGIQNLNIVRAMQNTAKDGQTASLDWVWGKHAWITRNGNGSPKPKEMTFGRNLVVKGLKRQVTSKDSWEPDGEWIRVQGQEKPWIMAKEAGYAIFNAVA